MTAIEIATGIIDKLQEENRVCLETLHKAQDTIKYSERQIAEKDRLIKVLEERLRTGTDGLLEMTNRQKELTIRHLELQIQKLLKENDDLKVSLESVKAEICPKCETRILLSESSENRNVSKLYKPPAKGSGILCEKKSSQALCPNRLKALEKIVEHKDKRIMHLSKEVQRLTKLEKELTQKVYRLTKLLPMSRLPPETVTECLLKEIQMLESQKQGCENNCLQGFDYLNKMKKDYPSTSQTCVNKAYVSKSADSIKKSAARSVKMPTANLPRSEQSDILDIDRVENEVLFRKLQKLCTDVNELKRLFAFESEKLSYGLNSTANEYGLFKIHLQQIIDNLNDVVQNILSNDLNTQEKVLADTSTSSDDKFVISCLQDRLKESLEMITEYENENKALKESLNKLKTEVAHQCTCSTHRKSYSDSSQIQNINDAKILKEIIKFKETQLETCQKFIEELQQKTLKSSSYEKGHCCHSSTEERKMSSSYEQLKILQTKLDVAEKNIKTCETVIEELQNSVCHLEEENARVESELHKVKSKAVYDASNQQDSFLYTKMSSSDTHVNILKKYNEELQDKVKLLEEAKSRLETNSKLQEIKDISLEAAGQEKALLKSKLDASEKQICSLEKSVETLQSKLKTVENEKSKLEADLKEIKVKNNLAETYENDVMALKTELILKEEENKELKESLHTLENKAMEMNQYRKYLHKEIENLCKSLMENENIEDSTRRKAIYKAAVLHSAQALLHLDNNYNLKPEDSGRNSALEELKHQIGVYLTEVGRIHELVTIKEQQRDELLREYLDLNDVASLRPSPSFHHESHIQGHASSSDDLQSSPNLNPLESAGLPSKKSLHYKQKRSKYESFETACELKSLQEELAATKAVTTYLLTNCTRLEDLLSKERTERAKGEILLDNCQETVKDLKAQLNMKNDMAKRLNTLIEMMRSKECNDEITLEQLKSEIKWLVDENQKIFEKVTSTQSELCQCREENCRIQNDLESLKRQLLNEKYENAKVSNELKHLRSQISQSTLHEV